MRPADYLPWGDGSDLPQGKKATTFAAQFSGGHTTEWQYDGKGYTNLNSNAGADDQFPADTVLALQVRSATRGTSTRPATTCRRRSSSATARRGSSTAAGWSGRPGTRTS